jgi:hypothetical protein
VLLAPTGARAPGRDDGARVLLEGRGWVVREAGDPLGAMAELCLLDRTRVMREEWGLQTVEALALVVVEPTRWPNLPALVSAVSRYVPQAKLWSVSGDDLNPLGPDARPDIPARTESGPAPRVAPQRTDEEAISGPLVTGDEIAMLLEGEPREPTT